MAYTYIKGTTVLLVRLFSAMFFVLLLLKHANGFYNDTKTFAPISKDTTLNEKKVKLGEKLFHETLLSGNGLISCASCHSLDQGGTDNLKGSIGVSGKVGNINSPTVFNVGNHFNFFWDGRARFLEDQLDGPITHPDEMASNWKDIVIKLSKHKEYKTLFLTIYRSLPTEKNIKNAIATFERSLSTPNSPFDKFLKGDKKAISAEAKKGFELFQYFGCSSCHQGKNLGGNMFQKFGVIGDYFKDRGGKVTKEDLGRYNVTGEEFDKHVFKVPALRNVELTAPYFHDGSVNTLDEAVDIMAKYQLGKKLQEEERKALVAFLKSLTGEYKGKSLRVK